MTMDAMQLFCQSLQPGSTVLVIGASDAESRTIGESGHLACPYDYGTSGHRYEGLLRTDGWYDAIYCAHTLEHMRNVGVALDAMYTDLKDNGLLCIVVPPSKQTIVGGHLTIWNAGLLLYNLVRAHFDCAKAAVRTYDYNVAVLVRKVRAEYREDDLKEDNGDIEALARFFPVPMYQDAHGVIYQHDWTPR